MSKGKQGFTIVELLVVIVIIAILASLAIVSYAGIQNRARLVKMQQDISEIKTAIQMARETSGKNLNAMTSNVSYGTGGSAAACRNVHPAGTNMAALPKTDACWVSYNKILDTVSTVSGKDIRNIVDPWGRPYSIAEMESVNNCREDGVSALAFPYNGWAAFDKTSVTIPRIAPGVGC